jgi:hypothetical protein
MRKSRSVLPQKELIFRSAVNPCSVVLRIRSWAKQLQEGRIRSCAEIARREGITPARVSQLWPLSEITREQADETLTARKRGEMSLRRLIRIARNLDVK